MKLSGPVVHTILIAACAALQSVFFKNGLVAGVTPDIALIILIFSANQQGSFRAQTSGFIAGIIQDFLSLTPLGFHAFTRTLIAYLNGLFKGKLFLDPILMPVLLAAIGTLLKGVFGYIILLFFSPEHAEIVFTLRLGVEIGLNSLIAPFLFGFLKIIGIVRTAREAL